MFALRFCAGFIERRLGLSPPAILMISAVLACVGLNLASTITAFGGAVFALLIYAVGKTFLWPTMLAITSDRFPRTGAIAISIMGGIGMMSAGLIGTPGLGYAKDRFAGEALEQSQPQVIADYRAEQPSRFLFFKDTYGLNGRKLGDIQSRAHEPGTELAPAERAVLAANITGDRKTLRIDSLVPAVLAVLFLALLIYFRRTGGYRPASMRKE
jgi:hypothetical protein